ncbi:hypothetical protein NQ317_012670 [Molorchus minor]|uniref:Uncharacterized protein n=1 Tax=Molorchus minor TaxID=1323400 RepID=A0ABQ9IV87_9CUCU|nr:hypothetical protein NQ317_012670 [Molorchus minor]
MGDSFAAGLIPLSTDTKLQDKYVTAFGGVRLGRLLEDMDMFAARSTVKGAKITAHLDLMHGPYKDRGPDEDMLNLFKLYMYNPNCGLVAERLKRQCSNCSYLAKLSRISRSDSTINCRSPSPLLAQVLASGSYTSNVEGVLVSYKHIVNPKQPENEPFSYTLVTALVDRIDFTDFIPKPKEDIKISGHVCWVGKSSMEVVVWLEQLNEGVWNRITRALFVMAARNSTNSGSVVINPIDPANERERTILSGGEDRKNRRIETTKQHTSLNYPRCNRTKTHL